MNTHIDTHVDIPFFTHAHTHAHTNTDNVFTNNLLTNTHLTNTLGHSQTHTVLTYMWAHTHTNLKKL